QFDDLLPKIAMQGFSPETLAWLQQHPEWDPRVRLAPPSQRAYVRATIAAEPVQPYGGHPLTQVNTRMMGDELADGLLDRTSQVNGGCRAAEGLTFDMAMMDLTLSMLADLKELPGRQAGEDMQDDALIDGMPESFVGPLLAHLVAHEVGHTLGLRHNFKASSIHTLDEINSSEMKGQTPLAGSVMDYTPVNIRMETGEIQGDYAMIGIGPYDEWAIQYGYTQDSDLKPILGRVAEPQLAYGTDEDASGPDPLARRYDFGKDPLVYADEQMRLVKFHRERILEKYVDEGDSWSKARRGYGLTLSVQTRAVSMMANWIGGVHVHRDKKGDPNARVPLEVVPADQQREALKFVIENTFRDDAYGLRPELLAHMTTDKWLDEGYDSFDDSTWPVHDKIMGLQASTLTMIMNPTTLQRVYDNEFRVPSDQDVLSLPELLTTVTEEIWRELDVACDKQCTVRTPMISSLRRNLQREHLKRLIDLSLPGAGSNAAYKPISNLSRQQLRQLDGRAEECLKRNAGKIDPYSEAHLAEVRVLISKALEAEFIYNVNDIGGSRPRVLLFHGEEPQPADSEN
ncbi:MAG: zinc-dependent metalloprotease, partial [Planctomycetaceae bacterium]